MSWNQNTNKAFLCMILKTIAVAPELTLFIDTMDESNFPRRPLTNPVEILRNIKTKDKDRIDRIIALLRKPTGYLSDKRKKYIHLLEALRGVYSESKARRIYNRFLLYVEYHIKPHDGNGDNARFLLQRAFSWSCTREGYEYWRHIRCDLYKLEEKK